MESDKIVQSLVDTLNSINNRLVWWGDHREKFAPLIAKLKLAGYDVELSLSGLEVKATGGRDLLLAGMRILYAEGFKANRKPKEKETWYATFFYKGEDEDDYAHSIWFNFTSNVCERVQIGTEMRECPVFEVRCGGESMGVNDDELS